MNLLNSLLLTFLVVITTGRHIYYVFKQGDFKLLTVQITILGLALVAGVAVAYGYQGPSISMLLNNISPLKK